MLLLDCFRIEVLNLAGSPWGLDGSPCGLAEDYRAWLETRETWLKVWLEALGLGEGPWKLAGCIGAWLMPFGPG